MRYTSFFALGALTVAVTACQDVPVSCYTVDIESTFYRSHEFKFTDCSEEADTYQWDFGDGTMSTDANPTHVYNDYGKYRVDLTTTNKKGNHTQTMYLNVGKPRLVNAEITEYVPVYDVPDTIQCWDIAVHADNDLSNKVGIATAYCTTGVFNVFTRIDNAGEKRGHLDDPLIPLQLWAHYVSHATPGGSPNGDTAIFLGEVQMDLLNQLQYTDLQLNSIGCEIKLDMEFELDPEYGGR